VVIARANRTLITRIKQIFADIIFATDS